MLERKVECGSEDIDVALHGPSFNLMSQERAMHSCPELGCRDDHPWRSAPGSRSSRTSPYQHSPLSQPATPTGILHRLENRFRRAQP
ncbi:hypothetical protein Forpe1208_v010423 [Fusarium oxysporum f. sp. rapae]|uniref:Uncharacterized protein n=1 Tax=Fusarium oxysporum f. sp. rapae TaxID=485398 RepID=A0A8J5U6Z9_FUSOX|nr:hypothetical protein Forpe1208_v010423 [Fusarium oxysporum f. sp. rapae]